MVACKMEAQSEYAHVFARLTQIFMLSRWVINKISASELRRKFIKGALLVGKAEFPLFLISFQDFLFWKFIKGVLLVGLVLFNNLI